MPPSTQSVDPSTVEPVFYTTVSVPTTGQTITLTRKARQVLLIDSALLAALTVTFPAGPLDKDTVIIGTSGAITLFTINGNGNTVVNALSTLISGGYGRWMFNSEKAKWFRIG